MEEYSKFELFVRAVGAPGIEIRTASPWLVAVDKACVAVRAGKTPAIDDPRSMATAVGVLRRDHVLLSDADGDVAAGTGSVTVFFFSPDRDHETYSRFDVRRGPGDACVSSASLKGERDDGAAEHVRLAGLSRPFKPL